MRTALNYDYAYAYLSARQLRLNPTLRRGLIEVAEQLDSGMYRHVSSGEWGKMWVRDSKAAAAKRDYFNMMHWTTPTLGGTDARHGCGSMCCIGGWLSVNLGGAEAAYKLLDAVCPETGAQLDELFNPHPFSYDTADSFRKLMRTWDSITPAQAAHQIRHYLTTGKVDLHQSLRPDQLE